MTLTAASVRDLLGYSWRGDARRCAGVVAAALQRIGIDFDPTADLEAWRPGETIGLARPGWHSVDLADLCAGDVVALGEHGDHVGVVIEGGEVLHAGIGGTRIDRLSRLHVVAGVRAVGAPC